MRPGIVVSNERHSDLPRMMEIDWGAAVILHGAAERTFSTCNPHGHMADTPYNIIHVLKEGLHEPGWRQAPAHPNMPIMLRHYHGGGWQHRDPEEWGRECARRANQYRRYALYHHILNEPNLHTECNLPVEEQWRCRTGDWYRFIADWFYLAASAFKQDAPWAKLGSPALASGHSDDQDDNGDGTIGLEIMRPVLLEKADFLLHHDYWHEPEQALSEWYGMRFRRAHNIIPELPVWVAECGWIKQNETNPDAGRIYNQYFADYWPEWAIGATIFIWDSEDSHRGHRIAPNPALVMALDEICKNIVPTPPPPVPERIINFEPELHRLGLVHPTWRYERRSLDDITTIVVHHTASADTGLPPTGIARYHVENLGWPEIGYHLVLIGDKIYQTNGLDEITFHARQANPYSIGVCLVGDFSDLETPWPTPEQLDNLDWIISQYPTLEVTAHSEHVPTFCPGPWFFEWREGLQPLPSVDEYISTLVSATRYMVRQNQAVIDRKADGLSLLDYMDRGYR